MAEQEEGLQIIYETVGQRRFSAEGGRRYTKPVSLEITKERSEF